MLYTHLFIEGEEGGTKNYQSLDAGKLFTTGNEDMENTITVIVLHIHHLMDWNITTTQNNDK